MIYKYFDRILMYFFFLQLIAVQEESGSALPVDIFRELTNIFILLWVPIKCMRNVRDT